MSKPSPAEQLRNKFANALRGFRVALSGQNGFGFHFFAAAAVVAVAWYAGCTQTEWLLLALCITAVIAAELFNTAIEHLARAVTTEEHPEIKNALDTAAAAVMAVAIGAKLVGVVILSTRLFG